MSSHHHELPLKSEIPPMRLTPDGRPGEAGACGWRLSGRPQDACGQATLSREGRGGARGTGSGDPLTFSSFSKCSRRKRMGRSGLETHR